jgi:hypothetical protein
MDESKADKFTRIAEKRVNTLLHNVKLLKQLSNKNNYEYTEAQRKKIISAIRHAINDADTAFKGDGKRKDKFKL